MRGWELVDDLRRGGGFSVFRFLCKKALPRRGEGRQVFVLLKVNYGMVSSLGEMGL